MTNTPWTTAKAYIITPKSLEGNELIVTRATAKEAREDLADGLAKYVVKHSSRAKKVTYYESTKLEAGPEHFSRFSEEVKKEVVIRR